MGGRLSTCREPTQTRGELHTERLGGGLSLAYLDVLYAAHLIQFYYKNTKSNTTPYSIFKGKFNPHIVAGHSVSNGENRIIISDITTHLTLQVRAISFSFLFFLCSHWDCVCLWVVYLLSHAQLIVEHFQETQWFASYHVFCIYDRIKLLGSGCLLRQPVDCLLNNKCFL